VEHFHLAASPRPRSALIGIGGAWAGPALRKPGEHDSSARWYRGRGRVSRARLPPLLSCSMFHVERRGHVATHGTPLARLRSQIIISAQGALECDSPRRAGFPSIAGDKATGPAIDVHPGWPTLKPVRDDQCSISAGGAKTEPPCLATRRRLGEVNTQLPRRQPRPRDCPRVERQSRGANHLRSCLRVSGGSQIAGAGVLAACFRRTDTDSMAKSAQRSWYRSHGTSAYVGLWESTMAKPRAASFARPASITGEPKRV